MGRALEYNMTTLRVSRAYVTLLSRAEGAVAFDDFLHMHDKPSA